MATKEVGWLNKVLRLSVGTGGRLPVENMGFITAKKFVNRPV